jgi:BarA-like signal transduction histidine kinase
MQNCPYLEPNSDLGCYVQDMLRQSKIEIVESHYMQRIKASEHPNVFRNQ